MKSHLVLVLLFISVGSVAQTDYKRKLDSLTTVHKVCVLESNIRNHRLKMVQLKKQKQILDTQLVDIQSFKLRRTETEKEEQLSVINELIEANATAHINARVYLTTLINDLVMANDDVKELQNY